MSAQLVALCFDTNDPAVVARFWAGLLPGEITVDKPDLVVVEPSGDTGFQLRFRLRPGVKTVQNQMHFDLTSTSSQNQDETVARALALGARHLDIGQGPDATHVVLADPEGNEFCVIAPGNNFLADCGFLGAVASDGSQATGYFWSRALGWPLVWDQDEETAIRSPHGGPKITWGGPPLDPKTGRYRLHFDLAPPPGGSRRSEVDRLIALGARISDFDGEDVRRTVLEDPDGHEFCVRERTVDPGKRVF